MKKLVIATIVLAFIFEWSTEVLATTGPDLHPVLLMTESDTIKPRFNDYLSDPTNNPFDLKDPSIIEQTVEYDPETGLYLITERIGDEFYRAPSYMTFEEYVDYKGKEQERKYMRQLVGVESEYSSITGKIDPMASIDVNVNKVDRLFGGNSINIQPQGNIDLTFGYDYQKVENPVLPERNQRRSQPDFDMNIQMGVNGQIGEKMDLGFNYNTQAAFDFENQLKLAYDSEQFSDDDIIKDIQAGNVNLPLRSSLIQGSQSLFGLRTDLQFGHLRLTGLVSQQRTENETVNISGGTLINDFEVPIDEYDENRHFFLSHYNRVSFEEALECPPFVNSLFNITRIEVWVTNDGRNSNSIRDIVALADAGAYSRMTIDDPGMWQILSPVVDANLNVLPYNDVNTLFPKIIEDDGLRSIDNAVSGLISSPFNLIQSKDFEKVQARKLNSNEFDFHPKLGFISLNLQLRPDQTLAVAYEYTYNGRVFKVGEFADEEDGNQRDTTGERSLNVLYLKMLKSTTQQVARPEWDLMMKNIYSLGAYQIAQEDFKLDLYYDEPGEGEKRYFPLADDRTPLLNLFRLDTLNSFNDPRPDGEFDFVPGLTIYPRTGKIMFPILEPFGQYLIDKYPGNDAVEDQAYTELYDSTVIRAREVFFKNRFTIRGEYKSSGQSSEISLNTFNIPQGSITVRSGGQVLRENVDYEVDYGIGRIRILNEAYLQPGANIQVSFENNSVFNLQRKTMLGLRADYDVSDNLVVGATFLKLFERPFTQKVNLGDDPINNNIYGIDLNYSKDAPWLTRLVDGLPLISTKAPSSISIEAEAAALKPGHSRVINVGDEKGGSVLIDDFEGAVNNLDLRAPINRWVMASVPRDRSKLDTLMNVSPWAEGELIGDLNSGVNRAKLNWYRIERSVRTSADNDNPYTMAIDQEEVYPNRSRVPGQFPDLQTMDLTYYPNERGPYNFELPDGTPYSAGLDDNGKLLDPESRWAGIMRRMDQNDFQRANYEFIEFWMLNPFIDTDIDDVPDSGELYFNLGNVSEDILRDSRRFFENGLPSAESSSQTDSTVWGRIPVVTNVINAFSNDVEDRIAQDVGLDGLDNVGERVVFGDYVTAIQNASLPPQVIIDVLDDPANDDYLWFRNTMFNDSTVFSRYFDFNGTQGNSNVPTGGERVEASTNIPDAEDIDNDNSLSESESYFEYFVPIERTDDNRVAMNEFITDVLEVGGTDRTWYRYRIPIRQPDSRVGGIQDFRSIRFMRMFLRGWDKKVTLRFASLDLVRSQWRDYTHGNLCPGDLTVGADSELGIDAVNIEENSERLPWNYVIPPGIRRERSVGQFQNVFQNEQSLSLTACNINNGCARGAYKALGFDMRFYDRLQMFIHGESEFENLEDGDYSVIVRLGSDLSENFYEYEVPLFLSRGTEMDAADPEFVWRIENQVDVALSEFKKLKIARDEAGAGLDTLYTKTVQVDTINGIVLATPVERRIGVQGRPNLAEVETVFLGIRNVEDETGDPAENTCVNVWLNELRVAGLDNKGGVAALARINMELADFGNLALSGAFSGFGFGALDQKINERSREKIIEYDVSTNLELSKLIPGKTRLKVPFYGQVANTIKNPQYDPYDKDILLKDKLASNITQEAKDSIKDVAQDYTSNRTINFTNVRLDKHPDKKVNPLSLSNVGVTYSYSRTIKRDPLIEQEDIKRYKGTVDYNYSNRPAYIQPLKNVSKSDWLKLLTEFNFNPIPNRLGFSTTLDRHFSQKDHRFADPQFKTFFDKRFSWDRRYNFSWDLTKSLKFDYRANATAVIDEPDEFINRSTQERIDRKIRNDSIWTNVKDFGRIKNYNHNLDLSYTAPTKLVPALDWINLRGSYAATYNWNAQSLKVQSLGNTIQNTQGRQAQVDFAFDRLYSKSKFLKSIDKPSRSRGRSIRRNVRGGDGKDKEPKDEDEGGRKKKGEKTNKGGAKKLLRPLMLVRSVRFNWNEQLGTTVPGFSPTTKFLGLSEGFDAPGIPFILGLQPNLDPNSNDYWLDKVGGQDGWITPDFFQNQEVIQDYTQNYDIKVSLEPINDFKIDITANSSFTQNSTLIYKNIDSSFNNVIYDTRTPREFGSFAISYLALHNIFKDSEDELSALFNEFSEIRKEVSSKLPNVTTQSHQQEGGGFTQGYGGKHREVLLPAFIAAYTGRSVEDVEDRLFDRRPNELPRPNWNISYDGLSKIKIFENMLKRVSISHAYKSDLRISQYQTNLDFDASNPFVLDDDQDYYHRYRMENVSITEAFNPLIGIDITALNDMTFTFKMNRARNLDLSLGTDLFVRETRTSDLTFGFGYLMPNVQIGLFKSKKKKRSRKKEEDEDANSPQGNDLNFSFDLSIRDDVTVNHQLDENVEPVPTRGLKSIRWSPSVDYQMNERLNLRLFVDYSKTEPKTSLSYPITTIQGGATIRFTLQ